MKKLTFLLLIHLSSWAFAQESTLQKGDTFPDFFYQGSFSKPYQLKELRGSYVLIIFWASWNEESRKVQMGMSEIYLRYKDRKFSKGRKFYVISVSLDEEQHTWERAIKRDNLPWKGHHCDHLGWQSPLIKGSGLQQIPGNFLLGPNGRVLDTNLNPEALESILKEM